MRSVETRYPRDGKRPVLRAEDISECHKLIDDLVELYNQTHPDKDAETEDGKTIRANLALNKIGRITAVLTEWAEVHILGLHSAMAASNTKWLEAGEMDKHSHEISCYVDIPDENLFDNKEKLKAERLGIATILEETFGRYGRMGWRMSVADAFKALNVGQIEWITSPAEIGRVGNPYDLENIKWVAIKHLSILMGQGWKKGAAQQKIAEACGTSYETIKQWEKTIGKERDKDKKIRGALWCGAIFMKELNITTADDNFGDFYRETLFEYLKMPPLDKKNEGARNVFGGIIQVVNLVRDYPLENLGQLLGEAGFRNKP